MTRSHRLTRLVAATLLAAMAVGVLAPAAQASHRRWKGPARVIRYKGPAHVHSTYIVRRSDSGAAIGGFLGGLFLGAVLANQAPRGFVYYDSYCGRSFASLDLYYSHWRHSHHPRVIRVVEAYPDYGFCPPPGYADYGEEWEEDD